MNIKNLLTNTLFLKTLIVVQGILIIVALFVLGYVITNRDKIPHLLSDERKAKIASALKIKSNKEPKIKVEVKQATEPNQQNDKKQEKQKQS